MKNIRKFCFTGLCALLLLLSSCGRTAESGGESPSPIQNTSSPSPTATPAETPEAEEEEEGVALLNVSLDKEFQTMIGFGAGYTWYSDWMLNNAQKKEEIADLLFKDAKLTILRFKNEYGYRDNAVRENGREAQIYELARVRMAEYGEEPLVLMSCWSPPAYLKSNDSVNGGGSLKKNDDGTFMYEEYGDWWAESVEAYQNTGVPIDYVSIQNECDFTAGYDGMELAQFESDTEASYAKAYLSVYDALQKLYGDAAPKMLGPETMSFVPSTLRLYMKDIFDTKPESVAGIAFHLYVGGGSGDADFGSTNEPNAFNLNFMDNAAAFGDEYPLWQTEFYRGTPLQTAMLINNSLVYGNLNAYIYWTGVWEGQQVSHDIITVGSGGNYAYGSTYWVMRHFSEFIRPGYIRVSMNFPLQQFKGSAFKSPDGTKLAVVLVNDSDTDWEAKLPIEHYSVTDSMVYQTLLPDDAYDQGEYYTELGPLDEDHRIIVRAKSITTIDITGSAG